MIAYVTTAAAAPSTEPAITWAVVWSLTATRDQAVSATSRYAGTSQGPKSSARIVTEPDGDRAVDGDLPHRGDRGEHRDAAEHAADVAGQLARRAEAHQQGQPDGDRRDDEREHDQPGPLRADVPVGPPAAPHAAADEHHRQHPGEQRRHRAPGQPGRAVGVPADGEGGGDDPVLGLEQVGDPLGRRPGRSLVLHGAQSIATTRVRRLSVGRKAVTVRGESDEKRCAHARTDRRGVPGAAGQHPDARGDPGRDAERRTSRRTRRSRTWCGPTRRCSTCSTLPSTEIS